MFQRCGVLLGSHLQLSRHELLVPAGALDHRLAGLGALGSVRDPELDDGGDQPGGRYLSWWHDIYGSNLSLYNS